MNVKKMSKYKDLIVAEKEKVLTELLNGNEIYNTLKEEDPHGDLADVAFQAYEKQLLIGAHQKEKDKLEMLNAALKRIEDATYGRCIDCKEDISDERLTAIPFTLRCIKCMTKFEEKKRREKM